MATKYAVVCEPTMPKWTESVEDTFQDAYEKFMAIQNNARGLWVTIEEIEEAENGAGN